MRISPVFLGKIRKYAETTVKEHYENYARALVTDLSKANSSNYNRIITDKIKDLHTIDSTLLPESLNHFLKSKITIDVLRIAQEMALNEENDKAMIALCQYEMSNFKTQESDQDVISDAEILKTLDSNNIIDIRVLRLLNPNLPNESNVSLDRLLKDLSNREKVKLSIKAIANVLMAKISPINCTKLIMLMKIKEDLFGMETPLDFKIPAQEEQPAEQADDDHPQQSNPNNKKSKRQIKPGFSQNALNFTAVKDAFNEDDEDLWRSRKKAKDAFFNGLYPKSLLTRLGEEGRFETAATLVNMKEDVSNTPNRLAVLNYFIYKLDPDVQAACEFLRKIEEENNLFDINKTLALFTEMRKLIRDPSNEHHMRLLAFIDRKSKPNTPSLLTFAIYRKCLSSDSSYPIVQNLPSKDAKVVNDEVKSKISAEHNRLCLIQEGESASSCSVRLMTTVYVALDYIKRNYSDRQAVTLQNIVKMTYFPGAFPTWLNIYSAFERDENNFDSNNLSCLNEATKCYKSILEPPNNPIRAAFQASPFNSNSPGIKSNIEKLRRCTIFMIHRIITDAARTVYENKFCENFHQFGRFLTGLLHQHTKIVPPFISIIINQLKKKIPKTESDYGIIIMELIKDKFVDDFIKNNKLSDEEDPKFAWFRFIHECLYFVRGCTITPCFIILDDTELRDFIVKHNKEIENLISILNEFAKEARAARLSSASAKPCIISDILQSPKAIREETGLLPAQDAPTAALTL